MISIKKFVFGPFQENTYVLYSTGHDCWIIDPGCYFPEEQEQLADFIRTNDLYPNRLLNTHCHIDHVFGNRFVCDLYDLHPEYHLLEEPVLNMALRSANLYNLQGFEESPTAARHLVEKEKLKFEDEEFEVIFVPGHSPGHVAFLNKKEKYIISGDVLFRGSIGRTDLPGGNFEVLMQSIEDNILTLHPETVVYSGHGPETRVGEEMRFNAFLIEHRKRKA